MLPGLVHYMFGEYNSSKMLRYAQESGRDLRTIENAHFLPGLALFDSERDLSKMSQYAQLEGP